MNQMDFKLDRYLLLGLAAGAVILTAVIFSYDSQREWTFYQDEFQWIVAETFGDDVITKIPRGIQQIWVEDLNRVDRCTTCHQGILWRGLENEPQPFGTHPDLTLFVKHPVESYGCTICHGGQGYALTTDEAHGFDPHWEEPLLGRSIAGDYLIKDPNALIQTNCNVCHRYERRVEGMEYINHAKDLIAAKSCRVCHVINGEGGSIGPDLTHEGDKHSEGLDFSNFAGLQTLFNWHMSHLKNPQSVVPNTIMPELALESRDAQALTMLLLSWRDTDLPLKYLPKVSLVEERTPEEREREARMLSGEGAFFIKKGCFVCHSISAYEIESPTNKGPDLSYAVDDIRTRFGKTLDEFVFEPTGTMKIIFGSMIVLSDAEKWEVINKLRQAYDIKRRQAQAE